MDASSPHEPTRIDPTQLDADKCYRLLTGIVVPRPVAWVTTLSPTGGVNVAPFSVFTFLSAKPPTLGFSVGRRGRTYKDTAQNILRTEQYVIHIADGALIDAVHESSTEFPADISEVDHLKLETIPSEKVAPPRIAAAPIAMECRFRQCLEFGETRNRFIIGEVVMIHARAGLIENGKIDTMALDPLVRIAGPNYARLGEIVTKRPVFQAPKTVAKDD